VNHSSHEHPCGSCRLSDHITTVHQWRVHGRLNAPVTNCPLCVFGSQTNNRADLFNFDYSSLGISSNCANNRDMDHSADGTMHAHGSYLLLISLVYKLNWYMCSLCDMSLLSRTVLYILSNSKSACEYCRSVSAHEWSAIVVGNERGM
jgi:hypothetical protein